MPTVLDPTTYNLQRSIWPQKSIWEHILGTSATLMALPKDATFAEIYRYIDEGLSAGQGLGPVFETAKNNKSPDTSAEYRYDTKTYYALFSLPGKLMRRARFNAAVLVDPYKRASTNAINGIRRDLSAFIFGNGGGSIGAISSSSNVATNTITLADTNNHRFFYKDMYVTTSTTDGTSGSIKSGRVKLVDVKREGANKGQLVADQAWSSGIASAAANDYLFREGVFGNVLTGLKGHIPSSAPSGSFLGVNRDTLQAEKAGVRVDATALMPQDAIYEGAMAVIDMFGDPDLCVLNTQDWNALRKDLGNQTVINVPATGYGGKLVPGLSYGALEVMGPKKKISVIADPDCPYGRGYMLTREVWKLASMGELVHLISKEPMMEENADSWESRFVTDSELQCEMHGANASIQFRTGS